ncbi:hypothetical protein FGG08_007021 [Glutinoglossum americanum]|uniref:Response regulatory domain-containing protein n=1 Tax=Glutinoglossum americanum TaxID=1670608 RepID=A0A9P8L1C5_9PEZI|nr:hypothetical protein FGG08_007021 [Glutinoglossum americanum]
MNTVAYAEDQVIVRESIAKIVDSFEGFRVICQASNGEELIECFATSGVPQILLLDLNMRHMNGYETAIWVKKHHPQVKILILSMFETDHLMVRALTVGVQGFLSKNVVDRNELKKALCYVAENDTLYLGGNNGELAELITHIGEPAVLDKKQLTDQEIECLQLACGENTHSEIARIMNVKSRAAMVMSAARNGLIPL